MSGGAKQLTAHGAERVHWGDIRRVQKEGRTKTFYIGPGSGGSRRNCGKKKMDNAGKKRKCVAGDENQSTVPAHQNEGKSLVLLQLGTTSTQTHTTAGWKVTEIGEPTTKPERRETEDETGEKCVADTVGHISGSKMLVLLQVNFRAFGIKF